MAGTQPVPTGGDSQPTDSPLAFAGGAAAWGAGRWTAEEWTRWRSGAWYSPDQSTQARGWSAPAD
eukprot:4537316-Alexandrium_andersonii.AAC.1